MSVDEYVFIASTYRTSSASFCSGVRTRGLPHYARNCAPLATNLRSSFAVEPCEEPGLSGKSNPLCGLSVLDSKAGIL